MRAETRDTIGTWTSGCRGILIFQLALFLLVGSILSSGCTTVGKEPVIGTWEWSDEKGYIERYTFGEDHAFYAEALGSGFSGTWEVVAPGQYDVTYGMTNLQGQHVIRIDRVLYDRKTDAIYFPAHRRVT